MTHDHDQLRSPGWPRSLPEPGTSFVGRNRELAELAELLSSDVRLLTLVGHGGVGKTRLALSAARPEPGHAADAVLVELADVADGQLVDDAVLTSFGLRARAGQQALRTVADHLADAAVLLVLDNCEHVAAGAARVAETLLAWCPRLQVLATSREPLRAPGEAVWSVPPMATEGSSGSASEAAQLFVARSGFDALGQGVSGRDLGTIDRLVRGLDGIPLAIELVASNLRMSSAASGGSLLDGCADALESFDPARVDRHQTMRRSLDWSHALLHPDEALLFRRLSVFAGGATLDDIEQVCADASLPRPDVLDPLCRLVDKSLVVASREGIATRFHMLTSVRQYAAERLAETARNTAPGQEGEQAATQRRHLRHFTALAELADRELWALDPDGCARLETEVPNFRAALEFADTHDACAALRIATALSLYWQVKAHLTEGVRALTRALAASAPFPEDTAPHRGMALAMSAVLKFWLGDVFGSMGDSDKAIAEASATGHTRAHAHALLARATTVMMAHPPSAQADLVEAARLGNEAGDQVASSEALNALAIGYLWQDDFAKMNEAAEAADAIASKIGSRGVLLWSAWLRTHELRAAGDVRGVRLAAAKMPELSAGQGEIVHVACVETGLWADVASGRAASAVTAALREYDAVRGGSLPWATGLLDQTLGWAYLATADLDAARAQAARLYAELADMCCVFAWRSQQILMLAAVAEHNHPATREHAALLAGVADRIDNRRAYLAARAGLARAELGEGNLAAAEALNRDVLVECAAAGWWYDAIAVLEIAAAIAARRGQWVRAARLLAGVGAARRERGIVRIPEEPAFWSTVENTVHTALDAAWPEELAMGRRMTLERLVEYAMRGRGTRAERTGLALTPTEEQVAALTAQGLSNTAIAMELGVATGTVKRHLVQIYTKLGIGSRVELFRLLRGS